MKTDTNKIRVGVYRVRPAHVPDDSPEALRLHQVRAHALHDALNGGAGLQVSDWGDTDDTKAHEFVELIILAASNPAVQAAAIPALKAVGTVILKAALGAGVAETAKLLFARLAPKQKEKKIDSFSVTLPDGTTIFSDSGSQPTIRISVGAKVHQIPYDAAEKDIPAELR